MREGPTLVMCLSTVASKEDADKIAAVLLERSLAACVQIDGPIRSHYQWEGQTHCDAEYRLMIKSSYSVWPQLKATLADIHPYDEPQVVMIPISDATDGYRDWVVKQTRST